MAGYIFSLDNIDSLSESINNGVFSTNMNIPKNKIWNKSHEGTFADFITMKEGHNVYFFHKRMIYGVERLINIKGDCKFLNFPNADMSIVYEHTSLKNQMILNNENNINNRMICCFEGFPYFFKNGVDMDEVLSFNPDKFKMLRAFWKLSFVKIDDEENKALLDIIIKNNEENLTEKKNIFPEKRLLHSRIKNIVNDDYTVNSDKILNLCADSDGSVKHEMALEAGILDYISNKKANIFGEWDYLSHQVVASPFKPIDYMDKMDIFGYRYIRYEPLIKELKTISKYLVIEIKKGSASIEDLNQTMKYVDWVNQEYSFGDYNMIEAFLVAFEFPDYVIKAKNDIVKRNYIKSRRPPVAMYWSNLKLIKYSFDTETNKLKFTLLD